jgi:predicted ribosomally synthesized peptide with SipW-like signal peptide
VEGNTMLGIRVPKRPKARTLLLAAVATAVGLALVPAGGTYALWSDAETVSPGAITSGSMTLTIDKPQLNAGAWSNLLPGQSATEAFTISNTGTTAASVSASVAVAVPVPSIASHMTLQLTPLASNEVCGPGRTGGMQAALTSTSAVTIATMPPNSATVLCAEVRLNADAPLAVQGQTVSFGINLTATQK